MPSLIDLTGQRFGRLLVVEKSKSKYGYVTWLCKCDCGNEKVVSGDMLRKGKTNSCGCLRKEETSKRRRQHGKKGTRLYFIWVAMKARCNNPNNKRYSSYGGRGIKVCDEWQDNFQAFNNWAIKSGYDENAKFGQCTLDRINVNGNYEPSNCRWATMAEQNKNKRAKNGYKIKEK